MGKYATAYLSKHICFVIIEKTSHKDINAYWRSQGSVTSWPCCSSAFMGLQQSGLFLEIDLLAVTLVVPL